ncbi:integrase core domain-containing protein [Amycolatopsis ruanii]|uniref:integrase core domain-containing protein n=1 Tax=Amycolatopsis ruanii TaxID=944491 RepID=UPI003D31602A
MVPPPRHHRAANPDRQRPGLSPRHLLGRGLHRPRAAPPLHQTGCPWTNGTAERSNRTLLTEFAHAQPRTSHTHRPAPLPAWIQHYNTERAHSALTGHPPITRPP